MKPTLHVRPLPVISLAFQVYGLNNAVGSASPERAAQVAATLVCGSILKVPEGYDHEPLAEVCLFPFLLTPNTKHAPMSRKGWNHPNKDHIPF